MRTCIVSILMLCVGLFSSVSLGGVPRKAVDDKIAIKEAYETYVAVRKEVTRHAKYDSMGIDSRHYLYALGNMESGNRYNIKGGYKGKYLGKYQFAKSTLKSLRASGYLRISDEEMANFLTLPEVQERAIDAYIFASNDYLVRKGLNKYIGRKMGGVTITKEGMLAAAHLVGPYAVVHFCKSGGSMEPVVLKSGVVVKKHDGAGKPLTAYMKAFQDC